MSIINKAHEFAAKAHEGQVRKYSGEPYISHPVAVADLVQEFYAHYRQMNHEVAICAALLHDVVEDCDVSIEEIEKEFGPEVAELVWYLTKPPKFLGKDAVTNVYETQLGHAPEVARVIKFFDIKHNYEHLKEIDPKFWEYQKPKLKQRFIHMDIRQVNNLIENNMGVYQKIMGI